MMRIQQRLGSLRSDGWRLRRSWPRNRDHLLLELVDPSGRRIAGQWFGDQDRAASVAAATPGAWRRGAVVLQPDGADRRLPAVADLLADPQHRLISHRPEKRAVIRSSAGYRKVVRPDAYPKALGGARLAGSLPVGAPAVVDACPATGTITTEALPGRPLTQVLAGTAAIDACAAVGRRLAQLHRLNPPAVGRVSIAEHGPDEEIAVLRRWTRLSREFGVERDFGEPPDLVPTTSPRLIHRDFHDGQVVMDGDRPGILDFDLMAWGDPALDLANFLAHLELRAGQGILADRAGATEATLAGYRPDDAVQAALPGYLASARMRLRAVYAFRDPELVS